MTKKFIWVAAVMVIFTGHGAAAQESLVEHLIVACESDLENYCSQVTPGNGRILHCMAAHEDKISGQCEYAFYQAATLLEQLSVAINYVAQECGADIQAHCSDLTDVEIGDGKIRFRRSNHHQRVAQQNLCRLYPDLIIATGEVATRRRKSPVSS